MKKLLLLAMIAIAFCSTACADSYAHNGSPLPQAAKSLIKKNFKSEVSVVKIDKDYGRVSEYEVTLNDGTEITFDRQGNWKDIETGCNSRVPNGFILKPISDFVNKNHKGQRIVGIEKNSRNYEVTLSNGIDIKFSKTGAFIKYDD